MPATNPNIRLLDRYYDGDVAVLELNIVKAIKDVLALDSSASTSLISIDPARARVLFCGISSGRDCTKPKIFSEKQCDTRLHDQGSSCRNSDSCAELLRCTRYSHSQSCGATQMTHRHRSRYHVLANPSGAALKA